MTPAGDLPPGYLTATVDGFEVQVPKGTLIIRAAELLGIVIPRFCDHPLLDPVGACRQCIVEVEGEGKPVASCTVTVTDGMAIKTQLTSPVADKAQQGNMEMLLINHPLDCPVCDKGGECPLQNQAMAHGRATSRFHDVKRTFPKPIAISAQVLLDRERCVLCARCTRFSQQIAGDPFIELFERGALEQVAIYEDEPFESYFSGNTVQICPVGALTGAAYRFRARPFDLVSTPSACEHCASGCALRTDWRRGKVLRRLAGEDPAVNEEWNCDKGRWAFTYAAAADRITTPLVRDESGELVPTSWTEALQRAAEGLREARDNGGVGVLPGGRLTVEDAYAYAKFARVVLGTNDIDMRARPHSEEELSFLAAHVVRSAPAAGGVTYAELESAPTVLLVGFEPEEESPIVFLRLRKATRNTGMKVFSVSAFTTNGLRKLGGTLLRAVPGGEPAVLDLLLKPGKAVIGASELRAPGAVILVGERLAGVPGGLSASSRLAHETGARLAWVPRRAGERGAVEAGALPTLLPGGRMVSDESARAELATVWDVGPLPADEGRDATAIFTAAVAGQLTGLLVGGVDPADVPDPELAEAALDAAAFVVSLELLPSAVTARADVVLPVAPAVEKAGTFVDWEGRPRQFVTTLLGTGALTDARILDALADELGVELGTANIEAIHQQWDDFSGATTAPRPPGPAVDAGTLPAPAAGEAVLATWHWLLDEGTLQRDEPHLAGTAKRPRVHLSAATAAEIGVGAGELVTVSTDRGSITLPLVLADLPPRVVWLPTRSPGSAVRRSLGADAGSVVRIAAAGAE